MIVYRIFGNVGWRDIVESESSDNGGSRIDDVLIRLVYVCDAVVEESDPVGIFAARIVVRSCTLWDTTEIPYPTTVNSSPSSMNFCPETVTKPVEDGEEAEAVELAATELEETLVGREVVLGSVLVRTELEALAVAPGMHWENQEFNTTHAVPVTQTVSPV